VVDRVTKSIPARWQRIENQINAAMIFARYDWVNLL
jgi:hypothetical protein